MILDKSGAYNRPAVKRLFCALSWIGRQSPSFLFPRLCSVDSDAHKVASASDAGDQLASCRGSASKPHLAAAPDSRNGAYYIVPAVQLGAVNVSMVHFTANNIVLALAGA